MITQESIDKWLGHYDKGHFDEAQRYYEEKLFPEVTRQFAERYGRMLQGVDILFSVLGFTPEPIILTQQALRPKRHVLFHFAKEQGRDQAVLRQLSKHLTSRFVLVELEDESFTTIYRAMLEYLSRYPGETRALDITGGKKSMVASAAIFGRDQGFHILYVDYDQYNERIRRPQPGTERLNIVYSPKRDMIYSFYKG